MKERVRAKPIEKKVQKVKEGGRRGKPPGEGMSTEKGQRG